MWGYNFQHCLALDGSMVGHLVKDFMDTIIEINIY